MNKKNQILKKVYCPNCEGEGKCFFGMKPGFNVRNMEITDEDDIRECSQCEGLGLIECEEGLIKINPTMATSIIILDTSTGQSDYLDLSQDNLPKIIEYFTRIEELANG